MAAFNLSRPLARRRIPVASIPLSSVTFLLVAVFALTACYAAPTLTLLPKGSMSPSATTAKTTTDAPLSVSTPPPPTTPSPWVPAQRQIRVSLSTAPSATDPFWTLVTRTATPIPDTSGEEMSLSTRLVGLTILVLFISLIICAMRMSASSTPASESVHPSARRRQARHPGDPDSPNTDPPHPAHLTAFGNPLAAPVHQYNLSSRGVPTFLRDYPPTLFPVDSHTLAAMQESPDQWHFLEPGRILPEFRLLLMHYVQCNVDTQLVKLFPPVGHPSSPARKDPKSRPRAICVQTRLPVPVPPEDARDVNSPYAGFRVPSIVYFEVRITALEKNEPTRRAAAKAQEPAHVAVGVAFGPYPPFRLPGWSHWSTSYASHNGFLYTGSSATGQAYGPRFGQGDVVGVGVETTSRCVFFTVNGKRLQMAVELPPGKEAVYPTVGATGTCEFEYNFGNRGEFVWDGRMFEEDEDGEVFRAGVDQDGWEMMGVGNSNGGGRYRTGEFVGYVMDVLPAYEE